VDAFVRDVRPDAYEHLVERLLASPAYGERWGRHWLDVAGYADSHGYSGVDPVRRYAWKYRDWVLRALNADKPFDRFVTEQLAGDELVKPPYSDLRGEALERLTATGFLRTAPDGTASPGADLKAAANQTTADTIQIVATALLGLSVHCAQCHNHRYDPIPQEDYYRLRAVFEPGYDVKKWRAPSARLVSLMSPADRRKAAAVEKETSKIDAERARKQAEYIESTFGKQLAKVPADLRAAVEKAYRTPPAKRSAGQWKLLQKHPSVNVSAGSLYLYDSAAAKDLASYASRAAKLRATKPVEDFIDALTEAPGCVPRTFLFNRGDPEQPRQAVAPGGLTVLAGLDLGAIPEKDPKRPTTGRRLAFARQLTSLKHPLTARVLVNRVWMHHFGRGIVGTPGDFGALGERPTHPELLDWLAWEFKRDWSLKRLHRLILTSSAYRQASHLPDTRHPSPPGLVRSAGVCSLEDSLATACFAVGPLPSGERGGSPKRKRGGSNHSPPTPLPSPCGGEGGRPLPGTERGERAWRQGQAIDPEVRLLWRMPVRRLEAEAVRDAILASSGLLHRTMFGPPVPVMPDEAGQVVLGVDRRDSAGYLHGTPVRLGRERYRRGLYIQVRRSMPLSVLEPFDLPGTSPNCERRSTSTTAPQALVMMNSDFVVSSSLAFAGRVRREAGPDLRAQVRRAWRLAFGPPPDRRQERDALAYLREQTAYYRLKKRTKGEPAPERQALATFCQALLSSNPFLYVE
jgi:hypothetical protein